MSRRKGAAATRIAISNFHWQRRLQRSGPSDLTEFVDNLPLQIRADCLPATELEEFLENESHDFFARFADFGPTLQSSLKDECQKIITTEQVREQGWSDATDNDRLSQAFAALAQQGVFVAENLGTTLQDGWAYAGIQSNQPHRGVIFFHSQDVITAVNNERTALSATTRR